MHHTAPVRVLQRPAQLDAGLENVTVTQALVAEMLPQGLALDVLRDEHGPFRVSDQLVDREDMVMVELGGRLRLA